MAIDFRRSPEKIEIILPMTVTKDEFTIGSTSWLNVCNFAIMNDMHIGEGDNDFGTSGWDDSDDPNQTNTVIQNNKNVVAAINNLSLDFITVLVDAYSTAMGSNLYILHWHIDNQ
uniref:Uncharacterized protein n=1 Tax=candidate division WOR-3 bacterium TaxID=2052148 RepID=A0A7V1EIL4_UNCW3